MISMTPKAEKAVQRFIRGAEETYTGVRFAVGSGGCSGFEYKVQLAEEPTDGDLEFEHDSFKVYVDPNSAQFLDGVTVDFFETLTDSGFKFSNPNAASTCGCGSSFQV